jgi:SAM-dependent methyltransferase
MTEPINPVFFRRVDESDDEEFYRWPRRVVHIDDAAIVTVGGIYAAIIGPNAAILDLMSSWRSHLPVQLAPGRVAGLVLNEEEMRDNAALTEVVVHNVNRVPRLPFPDETFDAAVMTVSVQYLTQPLVVFGDVRRVLRAGGPFIVTFSNRMFPTKAIALWQSANYAQRVAIVRSYFEGAGFERVEVIDKSEPIDPPCDPIWAVVGYRGN